MKKNEATLKDNEPHPAADIALRYIQALSFEDMAMIREAIYSTALEGNRLAEICASTLTRLDEKLPVSDRYLMGLAWMIYSMKNQQEYIEETQTCLKNLDSSIDRKICLVVDLFLPVSGVVNKSSNENLRKSIVYLIHEVMDGVKKLVENFEGSDIVDADGVYIRKSDLLQALRDMR